MTDPNQSQLMIQGGSWSEVIKTYRLRHGLSQERMAEIIGVAQRTISRWERGEDRPSVAQQKRLRDMGWQTTAPLLDALLQSVSHCPAPRALSRSEGIRLLALSKPAINKRPSVVQWLGRDLAPLACGVLADLLADKPVQRAIARGEIATIVTTTESVLRTAEHAAIGRYRTTISYFAHDGTIFQDAIGVAAPDAPTLGFEIIPRDLPLNA